MNLIFVNKVGVDFRGNNIYELLYTKQDVEKVLGEDWDSYPACGSPRPPVDFVEFVTKLETHMNFELAQNQESFDMKDCKHGVIPLAWEDDREYDDEVYDKRLFFSYGESLESVNKKLYERDIYIQTIFENG